MSLKVHAGKNSTEHTHTHQKHHMPALNFFPSILLSSRRDQEQAPLCPAGPVRRAPDPHGSASHVSISGTCSSVWRTRDLPVTPISSTRAFSNRLDVRGERREMCVWRDRLLPPQRENKRLS